MAAFDNYNPEITNIRPSTMEKYYKVADEYLVNGYDGAAAYMSVYPNCQHKTAKNNFWRIKKIPEINQYIMEQRQKAFDERCIDLMRVTEEISRMAFCPKGDKDIPSNVKLKALEMLQKALREDAQLQAKNQQEEVVIGLEGDSDEDNTEEESI